MQISRATLREAVRVLVDAGVLAVRSGSGGGMSVASDYVPFELLRSKSDLRLDEIADRMRELGTIEDELDLLEAIGQQANPKLPSFKVGGAGKQGSWDCDLAEFKARIREAGDGLAAAVAEVANACAHRLGSAIRAFTLQSARARQSEGQLEFHYLLVLARALLRDPDHGPAGIRVIDDLFHLVVRQLDPSRKQHHQVGCAQGFSEHLELFFAAGELHRFHGSGGTSCAT